MNTLLILIALIAQDPTKNPPAQTLPAPGVVPGQTTPLPPPRQLDVDGKAPAEQNGISVQTTGPIHEAYAQPIDKNPQPTVTVPKAPPPPVPEMPPSEKPEGANVQWIPGYWGWDPEKKDFLWVSGVWRNSPPDRKWEPGYWNKVGDGYQWTQGYWGDSKQAAKPQYLPQPPNSLEEGPSQPSPNENYIYVPGAWVFKDGDYVWRPGFWYPAQKDWVYVPPYYSYTPAGSIYVDGYWDYPLESRGTIYAPVTFAQPFWNDPGWFYQPSYALGFGVGGPWNNLFVGTGFGHYYCGNYFSPFWAGVGFRPWYAYGARNCDPLFAYNNWNNRYNPGWYNGLHNNYWARVNNPALRPPNTLAQAYARGGRGGAGGAFVPRAIAAQNAGGRGNWSPNQARNFQQASIARARAEGARGPAGGISGRSAALASTRGAGGPRTIAGNTTISGGSARIGNGARISNGPGANPSRFAVTSTSGAGQANFQGANRTTNLAANANLAGRNSGNYQSFYSGPGRAAPTPLYQASGRQVGSLGNNASTLNSPGRLGNPNALNNSAALRQAQMNNAARQTQQGNPFLQSQQNAALRQAQQSNALRQSQQNNALQIQQGNAMRQAQQSNALRQSQQNNALQIQQGNAMRQAQQSNAMRQMQQNSALQIQQGNAMRQAQQSNAMRQMQAGAAGRSYGAPNMNGMNARSYTPPSSMGRNMSTPNMGAPRSMGSPNMGAMRGNAGSAGRPGGGGGGRPGGGGGRR